MYPAVGIVSLAAMLAAVIYGWHQMSLRHVTLQRLAAPTNDTAAAIAPRYNSTGPLRRLWWWLPWTFGLAVAIGLFFIAGFWFIYSASIGLIVALLGSELETYLAQRRAAKLETQLADAIDLMIGALGAGTGVTNAMTAAAEETRQPLKGLLDDLLGRIRLGDDPQQVFHSLAERIPLETFTLFASSLGVHWEVGGTLTPTLAMVGRTIRDRIEIARRIRSNTAQSQLSTVFILLLTYFIAAIVWRNNPDQMTAFVHTEIGSYFVTGSMVLQCLGIVWMNAISKARF
jgi:Flp pilus assembly protein TadB